MRGEEARRIDCGCADPHPAAHLLRGPGRGPIPWRQFRRNSAVRAFQSRCRFSGTSHRCKRSRV